MEPHAGWNRPFMHTVWTWLAHLPLEVRHLIYPINAWPIHRGLVTSPTPRPRHKLIWAMHATIRVRSLVALPRTIQQGARLDGCPG